MAYGTKSQYYSSSILDGLSLSPLPYPVLLILTMVLVLLGVSWSSAFEEMVEDAEEQMSWALLAAPILIILAVQWLSSVRSYDDWFFGWFGYYDRRHLRGYYGLPQQEKGCSPWGVAGIVTLLLVLVHFQSGFQEMWGF